MSEYVIGVDEHLTRERFEAWLRGPHNHGIVGWSGNGCMCPVANFLVEEAEAYRVEVDALTFDANGATYDLPLWAADFVEAADLLHEDTGPVTAAQALAALAEVPA